MGFGIVFKNLVGPQSEGSAELEIYEGPEV